MKRLLLFLSMLLLVGGTTMAFANGANGSDLTRVSNNENSASTTDIVQPQNSNSSVKPLEATNNKPVITFTTSKKVGEKIILDYESYNSSQRRGIKIEGATFVDDITYVLTAQTVKIIGHCTELDCSGNDITSIDLSNNSKLTTLNCGSNQLTQIQLPKYLEELGVINCSSNNIDVEHMEQLINSLPERTAYRYRGGDYRFYVQSFSTDSTQITEEQANRARAKGWTVSVLKYTTTTGISTIDYTDASPRKVSTLMDVR